MAPPRQARLDEPTRRRLAELTAELVAMRPDSAMELQRYLSIRHRTILLHEEWVADELRGCTVVVTGGSGCVGTGLLRQLRRLAIGRVFSVAITPPAPPVPGVEYVNLDIRSGRDVEEFFARYAPDIVFHLAAERDPGLAEQHVASTVDTNVLGTRRVAEAAEQAGARRFVYASTGKALRPYAPCVYASTKRVGEWVVADVARRRRMACSGVRFTHVVDNSIVLDRLRRWCATDGTVRLHSPDTFFYAQSALESAQLLLAALLAPPDHVFRLHMIRDLGWPVGLLDLVVGFIGSHDRITPLYLAGHDPGYEEAAYAGLYDPMLAGDVSPLMNAMEAHQVHENVHAGIDAVPVVGCDAPGVMNRLPELERWCQVGADRQARRVLDEVAWELLEVTVRATSPLVLDRIARLTEEHRSSMSPEHRRIDDIVRRYRGRHPIATRPVPRAEVVELAVQSADQLADQPAAAPAVPLPVQPPVLKRWSTAGAAGGERPSGVPWP